MPESGWRNVFSISGFLRIISQSRMTVSMVRMRLMRQRAATISLTKVLFGGGGRLVHGGEVIFHFLEFIFVFAFEEGVTTLRRRRSAVESAEYGETWSEGP